MFFGTVCTSTRLKKGTNGKESKEDFEEGATWIVLMGRFYIAGNDMRTR